MARRSIWTRAKPRNGLERPHFVATGTVAVAPAQRTGKASVPLRFARAELGQGERKGEGETMSIINKPPEMVKREYELQEPIAVAIEKYATFIQSTPDHVVNSALKMVIWRDVEFRRWRKQTQADRKDVQAAPKTARA